ncbi:MAG: Hpt domain-containing protein [Desulfosarcinaceae bacterium]
MTDNSLLRDFIVETGEHLSEMKDKVHRLDKDRDDVSLMNDIFRSVHTIKGSSEYMGLENIAGLSHKLESLLDLLRRGEQKVSQETVELLLNANGRIVQLVDDLQQHDSEKTPIADLVESIKIHLGEIRPESDNDSQEPVAAAEGLVEEVIFEDENDEELFGIFLDQLKEGLQGLCDEVVRLGTAEAVEPVLEQCADRLNTLRSSANYMGYDQLKDHYESWMRKVAEAREELAAGGALDIEAFVQTVMHANIERVKGFFPKAEGLSQIAAAGQPAEAQPPQQEVVSEQQPEVPEEQETGFDMGEQGLLGDFITETGEHIEDTERNLLRLEQQPDDVDLMNEIFRSVHTIKGSSEYLGLVRIAELSHKLESLLDLLRRGERTAGKEVVELLIGANDRIAQLVDDLDRHEAEKTEIDDLLAKVDDILAPKDAAPSAQETDEPQPVKFGHGQTVYVETYDRELFDIFLSHLSAGLQSLREEAVQLADAPDPAVVLKKCEEDVGRLRSSANYMEYEELTKYYDQWLLSIREACGRLAEGETVDLSAFAESCLVTNIDHINSLFGEFVEGQGPETKAEPEEDEASTAAEEKTEQFVAEDGEVSDEPSGDQLEEASAGIDDPFEDAGLIERLESAFDARLGKNEHTEAQALPLDIEGQLLSEGQEGYTDEASFENDQDLSDLEESAVESETDMLDAYLFSGDQETGPGEKADHGPVWFRKKPGQRTRQSFSQTRRNRKTRLFKRLRQQKVQPNLIRRWSAIPGTGAALIKWAVVKRTNFANG